MGHVPDPLEQLLPLLRRHLRGDPERRWPPRGSRSRRSAEPQLHRAHTSTLVLPVPVEPALDRPRPPRSCTSATRASPGDRPCRRSPSRRRRHRPPHRLGHEVALRLHHPSCSSVSNCANARARSSPSSGEFPRTSAVSPGSTARSAGHSWPLARPSLGSGSSCRRERTTDRVNSRAIGRHGQISTLAIGQRRPLSMGAPEVLVVAVGVHLRDGLDDPLLLEQLKSGGVTTPYAPWTKFSICMTNPWHAASADGGWLGTRSSSTSWKPG